MSIIVIIILTEIIKEHGQIIKKEELSVIFNNENNEYNIVKKLLITYNDGTTSNDAIKRYVSKEEFDFEYKQYH